MKFTAKSSIKTVTLITSCRPGQHQQGPFKIVHHGFDLHRDPVRDAARGGIKGTYPEGIRHPNHLGQLAVCPIGGIQTVDVAGLGSVRASMSGPGRHAPLRDVLANDREGLDAFHSERDAVTGRQDAGGCTRPAQQQFILSGQRRRLRGETYMARPVLRSKTPVTAPISGSNPVSASGAGGETKGAISTETLTPDCFTSVGEGDVACAGAEPTNRATPRTAPAAHGLDRRPLFGNPCRNT